MSLNFDQFLEFCKGNLSSSKQLLKLVKKRYKECNDSYKNSESFFNLVLVTEAKIASDKARIFVHIKDFLQKLKEGNDQYSASSNEGPNKGAGVGSKRDLPCSSSEAESDTNPAKRRRTNEGTTDKVRSGKSCTNSEDESDNDWKVKVKTCEENLSEATDNVQQDDNDKNICSVVEDSVAYESCANVKVDSIEAESDSVTGAKLNEKENTAEIQETQSGEHYRITELITESNKMYSTSEDDSDKDTDVTKHIADIIQQGDDDENDSKKDSEMEKHSNGKDIINDNAVTEESCKTSDSKKTGKVKLNSASYDLWEESKKNESDDNETNNPVVDQTKPLNHEHENHKRDEAAESDDGNNSDSSLDECSVLENTPMSKSDKSNAQCNSKHSNSSKDETKKDEEKEERKNEEHSDGVGEESDDVHMISDDDEEDTETDKKLMLDKTQNFVNGEKSNEDFAGYDADKENKKVAGVRNISSSDEEDPEYAAKAKKFREKCKKKYVIHTGSKKCKNTETSPPTPSNNEHKKSKKKKSRSPRSPRSPRKSSPNKSSILIITDSESETDQESCPKSVSKLVDEKIVNHFKKELDIDIVYPKVVVNKVKIKEELLFDQLYKVKESDHDETGDDDEKMDSDSNVHPSKHSEKTVNGNLDNDVESNHKIQEKSKTKDSPKVKKRVNFTSEKLLSKGEKTENKDSDTELPQATTSCAQSKVWHKMKDRDKLSDNEEKDDTNQPGTSTADDREAARRKKGSEKQIRKLEKLLEQIRDQIEDVRTRELSVDELDSEISDYILEDKLQRKFMKVWDKLCELHQAVKTTGRPTDKYFKYQGTRYPDINRKIEKFINKKRVFPDFHDIRGIINKVNKDKRLHLKSKEIDDISKEAFTDVGNKLQKRRQKDFVATFQGAEVNAFSLYDDPALYDPNLKKKLDSNKKAAKHMMDQVVEKYAALQYKVDDKTDDDDDDDDDEEDDDDDDNVDANTGTEDFDRLLAGVDNSDSDNNDTAKCGLNNSNESGPCLEIENVESGSRSKCPPSIPLHKLGQSVKQPEKVKPHHDNPKSQHFADQLGLGMKRTTPENSITILSDDDDDNEVKCNGDTAAIELEVDYPDLPESDIEDDEDNDYDEQFTKPHTNEAITIITDDEDEDIGIVNEAGDQPVQEEGAVVKEEEMETSINEDQLELKIAYARHVSVDELDKVHKEGISRKSDEGLSNLQCENVKGPGELEIEEIDKEIDGLQGLETENTSEHIDLIPDIDTSCEAATVISSLESSLELDVAKSENVDSVKKCVSENLTVNDAGADLEVICVENDKSDIKAASSSGEEQVIKSSADEVKQKIISPEVVVLQSVDIIEPKPLTSKNIDSCNENSTLDISPIDSQTDGCEAVKATDIDKVKSDNILDVDNDDVLVATKLEISSNPGLKCITPDENNMETIRGELPVDEHFISGESQSVSDIFASVEEGSNVQDGSDENEVVKNNVVCENQDSQEDHFVEGQSESVPDIFASDDNCDLNDDQDEDTISEDKEVLDNPVLPVNENHETKDIKSDKNSIEKIDFVTCRTKTKDETSDNDRIETKDKDKTVTGTNSCSPCDLDKTTTSVDNIKKKLISLGSAITKQSPTVTLQSTSTSSQDKSKIIDSSKPSTSASLWNDYDENAGLIETYKEPEISKSLTIITEDIIAISSDSDSD